MTRGSIKANIQIYMGDIGASFWSEDNLNDSIQDSYTEIAGAIQAIRKNGTVTFPANVNYLTPATLLSDTTYLNTLAIFDINRNIFLKDNLSWPKDFQKIRPDWELMVLPPDYWCPVDCTQIVVFGRLPATSPYKLYYSATASTLTSDSDVLLLPDLAELAIEEYVQGDLLEQAEEFSKSQMHFAKYEGELAKLVQLSKDFAKSDFMAFVEGRPM
jgi:hypothetical protein